MRKCRNWQTSKTKDLVAIAVVWVQVPSSARNEKTQEKILSLFRFRTEAWPGPSVQGLRFAPVGANPRSPGPRAPHLPLRIMPCLSYFLFIVVLKNSVKMFTLFYTSETATGSFSGCMATHLWDYTFSVFSNSFRFCSSEYREKPHCKLYSLIRANSSNAEETT